MLRKSTQGDSRHVLVPPWLKAWLWIIAVSATGVVTVHGQSTDDRRSTDAETRPTTQPTAAPTDVVDESQPADGIVDDDTSDLESLLGREIEVTSVSKSAQKLSDSAAAIFVVTHEDIRRMGARSIPEALRIVPGLEVARVSAHTWAVTARGFNGVFANKLLVLIDGRTVYTPLFAGTFWDENDVLLEDVDRIEVIRGPGATLWGSNAVNGIINVITKSAKDTQGGYSEVHASSAGDYEAALRYGLAIDEETYLRIYAKFFTRNGFVDAADEPSFTDWEKAQTGFRLDTEATTDDFLTFQADFFSGVFNETTALIEPPNPLATIVDDEIDTLGANLLGRWTRKIDASEDFALQVYWSHNERDAIIVENTLDVVDIDFQHRIELDDSNEFIWGLGYRFSSSRTEPSATLGFSPSDRDMNLFTASLQNTTTLIEDELKLTIGTKLEHNDFSGFEIQPNIRMAWTPADEHTVWASVTRAVRIPSRAEHDLYGFVGDPFTPPASPTVFPQFRDNDRFDSESVIAYEFGYRVEPLENLAFDIAAFYNDYEHLSATHNATPELNLFPAPYLVFPLIFANEMEGETYGVEIDARWQVFENWSLGVGYTWLDIQVHNSEDRTDENPEGESPSQRFNIRSYWNVTDELQFNSVLYFTDELPIPGIPAYLRWDLQLRWQPCPKADIAVGVQNLLDDRHPEYRDVITTFSEVERLFYVTLEIRF